MKKNIRCDVIIPVYKSPEWVKLCVYSLFKNTDNELIGKVYLINDCNDDLTINCLNNLSKKYSKIELLQNKENLGFVKTANKGLKKSTAEYVLLLNTDCIISNNTIQKLINHIENDNNIGLICPISSNAANLTLEMYEGFSFMQMDKLLEKKFSGKSFDACTVVGNCLMITRECINKTGYLDEIYGTGYGEETDYQFKAMSNGFSAKVAIDTYVFHKSEASFGNTKEKQMRLEKNRKIFFDRWGKEYALLMDNYLKNDPIKYINKNITKKDKEIELKFVMYLIGLSQNAGGIHMAVDMVNYLSINNFDCNILYGFSNGYNEIMLFNPIKLENIKKFKFKNIVSTIYSSTYYCKKIADELNIPLIYFAQGYEPYFENGTDYGIAELSYKLADKILTISDYLKFRYKDMFDIDSHIIANGVNYDLLHCKNNNKNVKSITFSLRNTYLKGDFILLDVIKKIINNYHNIEINIIYSKKELEFPFNENETIKINKYYGPLNRKEIANILQKSDVFIDASFTEGFGLMALEAMAAGNVVIVSNSGGINDYIVNDYNGFIIEKVNDVYSYVEALDKLINDNDKYNKMKINCEKTSSKYDYDYVIEKYSKFFNQKFVKRDIILNEEEDKLYSNILNDKFKVAKADSTPKGIIYKICKLVPKKIRILIKKEIEKIYKFTNER